MFKKLSKDMWDIKKTHIELLEIKITMSEMKNILDDNNGRLDIVGKKISELEDIVIETVQMKLKEKRGYK